MGTLSSKDIKIIGVGLAVVAILLAGMFFRFVSLDKVAMEVDEPVNLSVAKSLIEYGYPTVKPEYGSSHEYYLFHPPIPYYVMAAWIKFTGNDSLYSLRIMNLEFVFWTLILLFVMIAVMKNWKVGLLALAFVTFDCWIITTNKMNYIENSQMLLIVAGIFAYWKAQKEGITLWYVLAALALGMAIIYKQIGVFLIFAIVANWLIIRRDTKQHILMLSIIAFCFGIYALVMYKLYGDVFIKHTLIQASRVLWMRPSRGLTYGMAEAVTAVVEKYWIYSPTIIALVSGAIVAFFRFFQGAVQRKEIEEPILVAWAVGGLSFAAFSYIKSPHYLVLWLIPVYCLLALELIKFLNKENFIWVVNVILLFALLNLSSWNERFLFSSQTDVVGEAASYINQNLPKDSVVLTEPYIATNFDQPYIRPDKNSNLEWVDLGKPVKYMALYSSTTVPLEGDLKNYQEYCTEITQFTGFKDKVVICQIDDNNLSSYRQGKHYAYSAEALPN